MKTLRQSFLSSVLFVWWVAPVLLAQAGPDVEPAAAEGYASSFFHRTSVDSINQFNGQLTIPIPLGPRYPIGPSLTFQAVLTYNSQRFEYGHPINPPQPGFYQPLVGDPALGIGWTLTLGRIGWCEPGPTVPPTRPCYFRPDGARIQFNEVTPGSGTYVTLDATQYKLQRTGSGSVYSYTMLDGDGKRYVFSRQVTGFNDNPGFQSSPGYIHDYGRGRDGWYLVTLTDTFGNQLQVTYFGTGYRPCLSVCAGPNSMQCGSASLISWIPQFVKVKPVTSLTAQQVMEILPDGATKQITTLKFKVNGGGDSVWTLSYGTASVPRSSPFCSPTIVPTLTGINLPLDIQGTTGYSFTYFSTILQGYLATMTMPTGATIRYDYGTYHFFQGRLASFDDPSCTLQPPPPTESTHKSVVATAGASAPEAPESFTCLGPPQYSQTVTGVLRRTVTSTDLTQAITDYTQYSYPRGETNASDPQTLTVAVMPPDANVVRRATATLFWAGTGDPLSPSLPGDRTGADLREATYPADPNTPLQYPNIETPICDHNADSLCADHAIRVNQLLYEFDGSSLNRRLQTETVYYGTITETDPLAANYCPACLQHTAAYSPGSTWESNGRHYSIETHSGSLGSDARTITTVWAPNSVTHLLNLFSQRTEVETGIPNPTTLTGTRNTIKRKYFYDSVAPINTGFLNGSVNWDAVTGRYSGVCRYADSSGNVVDEVTANVVAGEPMTNPCPTTLSNWPASTIGMNSDAFGKESTYAAGQPLTRRWLKDKTPLTWYAYRVLRDSLTGWITSSYDSAGLPTSFVQDSLGRVTSVTPPGGEAVTTISYPDPRHTTVSRTGSTIAPGSSSSMTVLAG